MANDPQTSPGHKTIPAGGTPVRRILLILSVVTMALGGLGGPLFTRIYFLHGGARVWLTSFQQNCAFPILFLPLSLSYVRQKRGHPRSDAGVFSVTGPGAAACLALGLLSALDSYMYAYGSASLPLSTSSLLISTQLVFTAVFAFLMVRQRFTAYSINAVVLLVMGPVVLGLEAGGDRPAGESRRRYYLGFSVMLGAAALYGLLMPLIEFTRLRMKRKVTHALVLEMQVVLGASATALCVVAMLINKDFQAIPREAKKYALGETKYYLVIAAGAIFWQLLNVGLVGIISFSSSLLAGIVSAILVPLGEALPVLVLHEKFTSGKGVAMALSIWGFASYLYGEYQRHRTQKRMGDEELELPTTAP